MDILPLVLAFTLLLTSLGSTTGLVSILVEGSCKGWQVEINGLLFEEVVVLE